MMNRRLKLVGTSLGIFICYFYYGILQEAITKGSYKGAVEGEDEKFTYTLSLVFFQCFINYLYALIMLKYFTPLPTTVYDVYEQKLIDKDKDKDKEREVRREETHKMYLYAACALTYLLAMVTSNLSLQWVSYPTQVVGKSCKPIPVMIMGVLLGGRSYSLRKYLFIFTIVFGVALFIYKPGGGKSTSSSATPGIEYYGELLLLMSLAMDGLTGAIQERLRKDPKGSNPAFFMKLVNLFSVLYLLVALLMTWELFAFISFVSRNPDVLFKFMSFSVASAFGQFFIFIMVTDFGPLPCSIVTTTRKFFTVLGSVLLFGNKLSQLQWAGAFFVFLGLLCDSVFKG